MFHNAIILSQNFLGTLFNRLLYDSPYLSFPSFSLSSLQTQILGQVVPHVNLSKASGRDDSQSPKNLGARVLITYCIEIWFAINAHAGVWSKQRNNGGRE